MDLSGEWRARTADDELRRDAIGADVDDRDWALLAVPGHWQTHPEFARSDGPLLYRRRFTLDALNGGARRWITFDGVFYQADVWLDGAYLGDPEGYFVESAFDVTELTRTAGEHVLTVEVACPPSPGARGKRTITGVYQGWEGIDPDWNPGGFPGPVTVSETGPVRVDRFRVLCRDADDTRAHLLLAARVDADTKRSVTVRTLVDTEVIHEHEHELAGGPNELAWSIDIDNPRLWWPRALGAQQLTEVRIELIVDEAVSDIAIRRTGLREVAWHRWMCSINGERLFLKGANLLPHQLTPALVGEEELRRDLALAADAGLDAVRVHGHIAPTALYEAADELGMLLLQDFPLTAGYARTIRSQAVDQARAAVDRLGHHPSIVLWAAHDDPDGADHDPTGGRLRRLAAQQLPSWNRSVLDRWVRRSFERHDPTRECVPHSGSLPHLPRLDGTDSHLSFGWGRGEIHDLERTARRVPRLVRFVSEFGAQSVPLSDDFVEGQRWPALDVERLARHHGARWDLLDQRIPRDAYASYEQWAEATRAYQAELIRHHVETLRRLKYRPTGGFCVFALNDPAPLISHGLIDHLGVAKPAYAALTDACAPLIVVADHPPLTVRPGTSISLDVHVVNDLRHEIAPAVVDAEARWPGGEHRWRFGGEVPADDCVLIGTIELDLPDQIIGPYGSAVLDPAVTFELQLSAGELRATNSYRSRILEFDDPER